MTVLNRARLLARLSNARHGNAAKDLRDLAQSSYGGMIESQLLGAPAASVTFADIPAYWVDLQVVWSARSTEAGTDVDSLLMRVGNGSIDTGSNYNTGSMSINDLGATDVTEQQGATSAIAGRAALPAAGNSDTVTMGSGVVTFANYAGATVKPWSATGVMASTDTSGGSSVRISQAGGYWASVSALTHIQFFCDLNFVTGSRFTLYGLGAASS